ncbi:hypothetical protein [Pseudomonas sp. 57B-090624]|uniref:hypothetical protein n=1 Tax=Pseudomonas sp. 57B-090624 TaxID=2213080 RepID=UPI0011B62F1E|nr:hypothetical protein [Pseudomonas sp. 57B-090624]
MSKFRTSKKIRASKLAVDEKIFNRAKGESKEDVANRILVELKKFDFYKANKLIYELGANKKLPKSLTNIFSADNRYRHQNITHAISAENHIYWLIGILTANADLLRSFNQCRQSLNCKILKGDAASALSKLDEIDELSLSWWSTEIRLHITKELQKKDTKELLQNLSNEIPNIDYSGWTFDLSLISESNSIDVYVNVITSRLREIRTSGVESAIAAGEINSCANLPISYDVSRRPSLSGTYAYRHESIIDQYVLLVTLISELSARKETIPPDVREYLLDLARRTDGIEVINILEPNNAPDTFVASLLDLYTGGDYKSVIGEITESIASESVRTFGLIELYARSIAYAPSAKRDASFFDFLAGELHQILQLAPKSIEKIWVFGKGC